MVRVSQQLKPFLGAGNLLVDEKLWREDHAASPAVQVVAEGVADHLLPLSLAVVEPLRLRI